MNNVCILGNILALGGSVDPDPVHVVPILSILFVSSGFMYPIYVEANYRDTSFHVSDRAGFISA